MTTIKTQIQTANAFAPASCANVAVGFDILGFSFPAIGDHLFLERRQDNEINIDCTDAKEDLPTDPHQNVASASIIHVLAQLNLKAGFNIRLQKGIPLGSGLGGSAASTVAALTALNAFLDPPLSASQLTEFALFGEELASGSAHPDNIVPCIFGGLTLIVQAQPLRIIELPIPELYAVIVHPALRLDTRDSRKTLSSPFTIEEIVKQTANLAGFMAGIYQHDLEQIQHALKDTLIEPRRAGLIPHFYDVKQAALNSNALASSISGSGPSIFALARSQLIAENIGKIMQQTFVKHQIEAQYWVSKLSRQKAYVSHLNNQEYQFS